MELDNPLKIRKPEEIFKPQVLIRDSNANDEQREDDGAHGASVHHVKKEDLAGQAATPTAVWRNAEEWCGRNAEERGGENAEEVGWRNSVERCGRNAVERCGRNAEERSGRNAEERGAFDGREICMNWNLRHCRFGEGCWHQHRCSKRLKDGTICKSSRHKEMSHR